MINKIRTTLDVILKFLGIIAMTLVYAWVAFLFTVVVGFTTLFGTVYFLYQEYGSRLTSERIDEGLPMGFLISCTIWLALLVIYKRLFEEPPRRRPGQNKK